MKLERRSKMVQLFNIDLSNTGQENFLLETDASNSVVGTCLKLISEKPHSDIGIVLNEVLDALGYVATEANFDTIMYGDDD